MHRGLNQLWPGQQAAAPIRGFGCAQTPLLHARPPRGRPYQAQQRPAARQYGIGLRVIPCAAQAQSTTTTTTSTAKGTNGTAGSPGTSSRDADQASSTSPPPVSSPQASASASTASLLDADEAAMHAAKIAAVASKITAARELARRLTEERQAASRGGVPDIIIRTAEEASATAAAQAARADTLARALRKAEGSRDQMQRLKAENDALRELLLEMAADKQAAAARLAQVSEAAAVAARPASPGVTTTTSSPVSAPPAASTGPPAVVAPPTRDSASVPPLSAAAAAVAAFMQAPVSPPAEVAPPAAPPEPEPPAAPPLKEVVAEKKPAAAATAATVEAPPKPAGPPLPAPDAALPTTAASVVEAVAPPPAPVQAPTVAAAVQPAAPPAAAAAAAPPTIVAPKPPTPTTPPTPSVEAEPAAPVVETAVVPEPETVEWIPEPFPEQEGPGEPEFVTVPPPRGPRQLPPPPRAPEVLTRAQLPAAELQKLADTAARVGQHIFTVPPQPVPIDGPVRLFYNRAKGLLPSSSALVVKQGINKWDIMLDTDMQPSAELQRGGDQDWWVAELDLPAELFRFDYVIFDKRSRQYDNNASRDYRLELTNAPTESELLSIRLEAYQAFENQRVAFLESENDLLWRAVEAAAEEAAEEARAEFRQRREAALRAEAAALVTARRRPELAALPAQPSKQGVFDWVVLPEPGQKAFLAYNKQHGLLSKARDVRLHLGYDGWWQQRKQVVDMTPLTPEECAGAGLPARPPATGLVVTSAPDWYGAWVDVPHSALILDFVFSDRQQTVWENNGYQDWHTRIQEPLSPEQLSEQLYAWLEARSREKDKVSEDGAARRAHRRVVARGDALRKRRAAINDFLYTVPYVPVAGEPVEVYYNPEHTALRGRPDIVVRPGFNRSLRQGQRPPPRPMLSMEPTLIGGIGFYVATLDVPPDAWSLDLAFYDTTDLHQDTGFYDDNGGLEYHIPVRTAGDAPGAVGAHYVPVPEPLKVVHIAVEMAPIAKVGGMGDVVTALGRAVQEDGHTVEVIIPKYDCIDYQQVEDLRQTGNFQHSGTNVRVWKGFVEGLNVTFLEPENGHFWRGVIYGRNDDNVRFAFLCSAALAYLQRYDVRPHVLHCHDWQTAPVAYGPRGSSRCVFTIHNLGYGADLIGRAMASCEVATTVSPTYASEISGQPGIAPHLGKLFGIRNGIDTDVWNPLDDEYLPMPYGPDDAMQGKAAARRELRRRLGLSDIEVPIVACVTRLVAQKGIHLIKHAAHRTVERGGQFVLLGSAPDSRVQQDFNLLRDQLKTRYHDRAALIFSYDEPLSHLIYAGSDMFLVPSMFEPCGLTQMIAMQYGTVPVVRKTGGLADTVFDLDHDEERAVAAGMETNGFMFEGTDTAGLDYALNRALSMWYSDRRGWHRLVSRVMRQDWSWFSPSLDYVEIYYKALRN